jgi:hypothetical protein
MPHVPDSIVRLSSALLGKLCLTDVWEWIELYKEYILNNSPFDAAYRSFGKIQIIKKMSYSWFL